MPIAERRLTLGTQVLPVPLDPALQTNRNEDPVFLKAVCPRMSSAEVLSAAQGNSEDVEPQVTVYGQGFEALGLLI